MAEDGMGDRVGDASGDRACELCEAARLTEWYHEDDECWIAECEACSVPMVVWRTHWPDPPEDVRQRLWDRLDEVMGRLDGRSSQAASDAPHYWIDDRLRTIPEHYHAHARRRPW